MNFRISDYEGRINLLIAICAASIVTLLLPPLDAIVNTNLTVRMIEDTMLIVYSISIGYGLERRFSLRRGEEIESDRGFGFSTLWRVNRRSKGLLFGIVLPAVVLAFWNFPVNFDVTATNVLVRYTADFTYLAIGVLIGTAVTAMPRGIRAGVLLLTFLCMGMMGSMMIVWQPGFYTVYPPSQNLESNMFLMLMGAFGILVSGAWTLKVMSIV